MATELQTLTEIKRSVGSVYGRIAPAELHWPSEREFLVAQIQAQPIARQAVASGSEETIESIKIAARECAAMGLSMSLRARHVYMIPRRQRWKRDDESRAEYERTVPWIIYAEPSYMGLAYIATHYAAATDVAAEVVFAADKFEYRGPMEKPVHVPTLDNAKRKHDFAIGVYALVRMASGNYRCEYIDAPTVQRIRAMSDRPGGTMWNPNGLWTEGWKKSAVRRLSKLTMGSNERMQAAEGAMQQTQGYTFDEKGEIVDVPRGTSGEPAEGPGEARPRRGMDAMQATLDAQRQRAEEGQVVDEVPPARESSLASPAPSDEPVGSIEWWADQVKAADSLERMDDIRVAALTDHVNQGDDADAFRTLYSARWREIKGGPDPSDPPPAPAEPSNGRLFG